MVGFTSGFTSQHFDIMHSFTTLQRRVERTRRWLDATLHRDTAGSLEGLDEDVFDVESIDESFSDLGVQSLSEQTFGNEEESLHFPPPTTIPKTCRNPKPSTSLMAGQSPSRELESTSTSDDIYTDHREFCEWLLNRMPLGSSYMSDGSMRPDEDARHASTTRKAVINYELCSRRSDNTFRDLRSASKARKRQRKEQEKYYCWKGVKPGWLGQKVHDICELDPCGCFCNIRPGSEVQVKIETVSITKKMMYEKAQRYPRPPTYHRSTRKSYLRAWHSRIEKAKKESKHPQCPGVDSLYDDFDDRYEDNERHAGDNELAWFNDWWDWRRQENWCHICDVPWGRCAGAGCSTRAEVDEIESLTFETSADRKSWKLSWTPTMRSNENRAPAVLPYTKQDWVAEGYIGLYNDDDAVPGW